MSLFLLERLGFHKWHCVKRSVKTTTSCFIWWQKLKCFQVSYPYYLLCTLTMSRRSTWDQKAPVMLTLGRIKKDIKERRTIAGMTSTSHDKITTALWLRRERKHSYPFISPLQPLSLLCCYFMAELLCEFNNGGKYEIMLNCSLLNTHTHTHKV